MDFTKNGIVIDWLSVKENRDKLPKYTLSKSDFDCLVKNGKTYQMWGPDEVIYEVNDHFYKINYSQ